MQNRILTDGQLHRSDGILSETGYAYTMMKTYDRQRVKAPKWRIKEWDYYLVCSDYAALALTIADNGYMGLDSISLLDFENKGQHTVTKISLFPMGKRQLPENSFSGTSRTVGRDYEINFVVSRNKRELYGHFYDFKGTGKQLLFDLELTNRNQDSMVIVTPFRNKPNCFYYNHKINCLPAEGRVIFGDKEYLFSPATAFGILDWGRGVWPYRSTWYWGSSSGIVDGGVFGLNVGCGFGDTSKATENMLFYKGIGHKLGQVEFSAPNKAGHEDYLAPWQVYDDAGRLKLVFEPALERAANMNAFLISSNQHQVFGRFTGTAVLDDRTQLNINGLNGFLEKVSSKW
jgi:hypothetical protein